MEALHKIVLLSLLFPTLATCTIQDTMTVHHVIRDGDTLVSASEVYALGFFSPVRSTKRYLGIWYNNISPQTVVWVANRETPITDSSGVFKLATNGSLLVISSSNNTTVWSSKTTLVSPTTISPVAQLLNSGNLVVRGDSQESSIWESFDYPGDTLLPGMKYGKDLVSGLDRRYRPWKSLDDPSPGEFVGFMDTDGFPQTFEKKGSVPIARFGPWNGNEFNGMPKHVPGSPIEHKFVFNEKEVYYTYNVVNNSFPVRIYANPEGKFLRLNWVNGKWKPYWKATQDMCAQFRLCGPNGWCNPHNSSPCSCMEGFEPRKPDEWNASVWSSGCRRRKPLNCPKGDGFLPFKSIKLPDTRRSWYNRSMTLDECASVCKRNCSCTAYANIEITNGGSGCLLWFHDLVDVRTIDEETQDLYVRLASSELTIQESGTKRKRGVTIVALSITSSFVTMILVLAIVYAWNKKKRNQGKTPDEPIQTMDKEYIMNNQHDDDTKLSYFSMAEISKSTKGFSNDKKLGQGGFGLVYMGVLDDGQEIAVKKLSKTSRQGVNEFKNELKFIAKLQHRNLVKLLGYCNEGDESMLIYEYMPNKSLDLLIFDKDRSLTLDWSDCFNIIHGIIRGLLYLHHDSRFKIVHRDLKASNILLDADMNPKISDFGLARMFRDQENEANTKRVVGTLGYISPEYAIDGTFSEKSDVFSFGVLVLEIVSGKTNRGFSHEKEDDNLLAHAWRLYEEGAALELLSSHMRESCVASEVLRSIHIGLLCVQHHAKDRPTMLTVALMFDQDGALPPPKQPAFFGEGILPKVNQISINEVTVTTLEPR